MSRSYYSNSITDFLKDDSYRILGLLGKNHSFELDGLQKNSWIQQIRILKESLSEFSEGQIYFEFSIPRMGKRVDTILLIKEFIFVLEFKVGDTEYRKHAIEQTVDYCLDLQNFHEGSHHEKIAPILVATKAPRIIETLEIKNNIFEPLKSNQDNLAETLNRVVALSKGNSINPSEWEKRDL